MAIVLKMYQLPLTCIAKWFSQGYFGEIRKNRRGREEFTIHKQHTIVNILFKYLKGKLAIVLTYFSQVLQNNFIILYPYQQGELFLYRLMTAYINKEIIFSKT